jgi:MoaA/NifB/PqqE/SkfB family radical SAM enzyme
MPLIVPTKRCNLRCNHCMRSTFASDFLDPGLHDKFIADMLDIKRHHTWGWTGGEPTLHPDMDTLFQSYRKRNIRTVGIMTNGQIDWGVETVIKNKDVVNFIRLSLDGPTADVNDKIRGQGTFARAIDSIKEYNKSGIKVVIGVTVHKENIEQIEECFKLGMELGVHGVNVWGNHQWVDVSSSETRNKSLKKDFDDIKWNKETSQVLLKLREELIKKYQPYFKGAIKISKKFIESKVLPNWICGNYSTHPLIKIDREAGLILMPDGKVSICCDIYDVDYNELKFEANIFEEDPLNHIIGDLQIQTLEEVLVAKEKHFEELARRRSRDSLAGLLKNGRENICSNCAYYHYQPKNSAKSI